MQTSRVQAQCCQATTSAVVEITEVPAAIAYSTPRDLSALIASIESGIFSGDEIEASLGCPGYLHPAGRC